MKVYWIKIFLRGVSSVIWRRLRIPDETSPAMLHDIIQVINEVLATSELSGTKPQNNPY